MAIDRRLALSGILFIGFVCVAARPPGGAFQVLLNDRPVACGSLIEAMCLPDAESPLIFVLRNTGDHPLRLCGPLQIHGPDAARLVCASPPEANGGLLAPGQSTAFRIELRAGSFPTAIDAEVTLAIESAGSPTFAFRVRAAAASAKAASTWSSARGQQHVRDAAGVAHPDFL